MSIEDSGTNETAGATRDSQQHATFKIFELAYRTNPGDRKNIAKKLCDLSDAMGKVSD